jgi:2-aminoadipate transaminase
MNAPASELTAVMRPARRTEQVKSSMIREILKVTQRPDMISLAGGLPAPETFPIDAMRAAFDAVLSQDGPGALQYSTTEGYPPLREWIAAQETARGAATHADEVLIVAGSQQALDLVGKGFAENGAPLLVEAPSYLGALQAFSVYEPTFRTIPTDDAGLMPQTIDARLAHDARIAYVMPNFQNPTGRTLTVARREALAQSARANDLWLVEDDPYGELWYRAAPAPSLRFWAPERTIRICSFSKILAPGLRLGYVVAPRACIDLLVRLKQATDLHTATLSQRAAHRIVSSTDFPRHLERVRTRYADQCRVMMAALEQSMPARVEWTRPVGGMFVWLTLPAHVDTTAMLTRAIERHVVYVPGEPFYAGAPARNTLRLSFVTVPPAAIERGIRALADLIRAEI